MNAEMRRNLAKWYSSSLKQFPSAPSKVRSREKGAWRRWSLLGGPPDTGNTSSKGIKRPWSLFLYSDSHAWSEFCSHHGVLHHRTLITGSTNQGLEPLQSEPKEYMSVFTFELSQGELMQGRWEGGKHALCNTKPECQPDRDTEAPVSGDGVQPTFIRVPEEHKHTSTR